MTFFFYHGYAFYKNNNNNGVFKRLNELQFNANGIYI